MRTTRRRGNRDHGRAEIVVRTIDAMRTGLGPDPTLNDVITELGIAKPTFYRFFDDKSDLFWAIVDKVRDDLMARVPSASALLLSPLGELYNEALSELVGYADSNPTVVRFVLRGQFAHRSDMDNRPQADANAAAARIVALLHMRAPNAAVDIRKVEFYLHALLAACGSACDWWLGPDMDDERSVPRDEFIGSLVSLVTGLVSQFADDVGVVHNPQRVAAASFIVKSSS